MIHLTPRLLSVAAYVTKGSVLADIGTDHAYLPAYLIENGIIARAFACDIHEGPLQNAKTTVNDAGITGVEFILSDGLQGLEPQKDVFDTVVMAGMGGELMCDILSAAPWCRREGYTFILQPMSRANILRRYLYAHGFEILHESIAKEKDKLYNIMKVRFTSNTVNILEVEALLGKTTESEYYEELRAREIKRLQKMYAAFARANHMQPEQEKILELIKEIEEYTCLQ